MTPPLKFRMAYRDTNNSRLTEDNN
jgi:hypothetical protein